MNVLQYKIKRTIIRKKLSDMNSIAFQKKKIIF